MAPDPVRLAADPGTAPLLRSMVEDARQALPDPVTLAQLAARVDAAIIANAPLTPTDPTEPARTAAASGAKTGLTAVGKAAIVATSVIVVGLSVVGLQHATRTAAPAPLQRATVAQAAPAPSAEATTSVVTSIEQVPAAAPSPAAVGEPKAAQVPTTIASSRSARPTNRDATSESSLLHAARAALAADPRRALELTREHARRFPKGDLAQEREVIAIEALRRLGQSEAAQQRGSAFEKQYPGSAHQPKVEQTLKGRTP